MRKGITLLSIFIVLGGTMGYSQSRFAEFNKFRDAIHADHQKFKSRILEHYADFLGGEWHEFEAILEDESPYSEPKPESIPLFVEEADSMVTNMMMTRMPDAVASQNQLDTPIASPSEGDLLQGSFPMPGISGAAGIRNSADGASAIPSSRADGKFHFNFYGLDAFIPDIDFNIADSINSTKETADSWMLMSAQDGGAETARQLSALADQIGLNGYLTFRLAEAYVNQKYPESNDKARMAAVHFLLSNMGYDARLCKIADMFTLLLPFEQKVVYGLFPKTLDGRKYYAMFPDGFDKSSLSKGANLISTCPLPSDALGKTSDLRLAGLNLPLKPKEFEIAHGSLSIKGVVNENIRNILYKYPQMPAGDFASSWIDASLRDDIVAQLKAQMDGMPEEEAINTLMALCHYGFKYSTDQKYHGFEKPYFLEENFIYDYNDCEDRAIFFSYIVWNALGLPCQIIQYPGHESVTIAAVSDIDGCFYDTEGVKYYSSDPTYCGSSIGQVMPTFKTASPKIDKQYK